MQDVQRHWRERLVVRFNPHGYQYCDVIMGAMASQITSHTIVYSTVHSGVDERKHQSSASLAFVRGIHWWPVNSQQKWPVTRKMLPFDDVIMWNKNISGDWLGQNRGFRWRAPCVDKPSTAMVSTMQQKMSLSSRRRGFRFNSLGPNKIFVFPRMSSAQVWLSQSSRLPPKSMVTSSNGNIFSVTGPLWGESTAHRWIPLTKTNDEELWYFLWSAPEKTRRKQSRRDTGDLRRYRAHYDVTVMYWVTYDRSKSGSRAKI